MERSDLKTEPTRCLGSVTPCSVPLGRLSQTISKVTKMIGTKERFKRSRRSSQRFPPQMFPYMAQGHEYSYVYIMYCFFGPSTALKWKWHALYKKKMMSLVSLFIYFVGLQKIVGKIYTEQPDALYFGTSYTLFYASASTPCVFTRQ